ncbi:MAG: IS66 family transposase [Mycoplasmatota bacterium]
MNQLNNEKLLEEIEILKVKNDMLLKRNEELEQLLHLFKTKVFGSKKENLIPEVAPNQLSFFDNVELTDEVKKEIDELKKELTIGSKAVKKNKKTGLTKKALKEATEENIVSEIKGAKCPQCGEELKYMAQQVGNKEVVFIPASFKIINHISQTYKCPCCGTKNDNNTYIVKTTTKKLPISSSLGSSSIITDVIYQKFLQGVPLYRQELVWKDRGVILQRNTMANWVISSCDYYFKPLHELMLKEIKKCNVLHADETTIQVNKEENKKASSNSYMWVLASGKDEKIKSVVFNYYNNRSSNTAEQLLTDFKNNLITDGYASYNNIKAKNHGGCWSHARRYFFESIPNIDNKPDENSDGYIGVLLCNKLFELERKMEVLKTDEEKLEFRNKYHKKTVNNFYEYVEKTSLKPTNSKKLNKALTYAINQKEKLTTFLKDINIPLTNNLAERSIRPFAVHRKNWLFADTVGGANANAILYTLIESCKLNQVNTRKYINYLLDVLPQIDELNEDILKDYLPYSTKLPTELYNLDDNEDCEPKEIEPMN